jgi:hypothetical protein
VTSRAAPTANPKPLSKQERAALSMAARRELAQRNDAAWLRYCVKIVGKDKRTVPLRLNPIQQRLEDEINRQETLGMPVRIIVLKARQEGVSTYAQGKILKRTTEGKNRNALVMAHRDDATGKIFSKAKYMYENMPEWAKPLQKASNAQELVFDKPTHYRGAMEGLNSSIRIQTAGSKGAGRSDTLHYVHLSEFAFYPGNPGDLLDGIMNAVPDEPGTIVIIESTANGFNEFKALWDGAVKGENGWTPMFFAWHDMPEYAIALDDDAERAQIMDSLSEYEKKIVGLFQLSAEQIKWYRRKMKISCRNNHDKMRQENPSFPDEAFLMTGNPVFDNEIIQLRIEELKKRYAELPKEQQPRRGRYKFKWRDADTMDRIVTESIEWVDDENGPITLYEQPKPGYPYVLGGDTKGEGHDWYSGTLLDNVTGRRVATLHMQSNNSKPYTHQVYCLGRKYHDALIGIEINFNTAPVEELQRLGYPNQYRREKYDQIKVESQERYGWKTDQNTRPVIIDNEIEVINGHPELFFDIPTLEEAQTFAYDENNRPDAMSGKHDDLLFSDMIAGEIRSQQRFTVLDEPTKHEPRLADQLRKRGARRI